MKKTNEIKSKMLTDEQAGVVKTMIVESMRSVWVEDGAMPKDTFIQAAATVAERIIQSVQMALMQGATFEKAVRNSEPLKKVKKPIKKVIKKIKKHVRK